MAKREVAQKLIVVESIGTIGELGGISGPVLSPCYVPIDTINLMLNHHRRVYEVNPKNYNEKIPLNLRNLRKENFAKETAQPKARMAPNIYTTATVRNSNEVKGTKDFSDNVMLAAKVTKAKKAEAKVEPKVEAPVEAPKPTSDFTKDN